MSGFSKAIHKGQEVLHAKVNGDVLVEVIRDVVTGKVTLRHTERTENGVKVDETVS
jgi:hypothetical protein